MQVIESLKADRTLGKNLKAPSVSYGTTNLYMRGVLEEETRGNLSKVTSRRMTSRLQGHARGLIHFSAHTLYVTCTCPICRHLLAQGN